MLPSPPTFWPAHSPPFQQRFLRCKPSGADVWSLQELAAGEKSVLVPQRCIDWDSSGKKPNMNVRVEVGPAAERFRLGDIIAALPALAVDMGGFSKLGLERVNWVRA